MSRKTIRNRGKKREVIPSYALGDFGTQKTILGAWYASAEKTHAIRALLGKLLAPLPVFQVLLHKCAKRIAKHRGASIWQKPHQGAEECARRIRQGVAA